MAFITSIPLTSSFVSVLHNNGLSQARRPRSVKPFKLNTPQASLIRDFTAGPESPGVPRKLTQVVVFSSLTGLLWYGYYKWCIEEELRLRGQGKGAIFALGPFGVLFGAALFAPPDIAPALATGALAWIMSIQYSLYRRINTLYEQRGAPKPMQPHWVILPGLNLLAGLRSLHFLAAYWSMERGECSDDPLAQRFPMLSVPTLDALELFTSPKLWLSFNSSKA